MPAAMRQPTPDPDPEPGAADAPPFDDPGDDGRRAVTLKPRGVARFGGAAFLAFWLCGWALGEAFASAALLGTVLATFAPGALDALGLAGKVEGLGGGGVFVMGFLAVWLTFWTIGGLAAMRELLRMVASSDRVAVVAGALELDQRLGPFRSRQRIAAHDIRRIAVNPRGVLVATTTQGPLVLSALGSAGERAAVAAWLERELAPARDDSDLEHERRRQRTEPPPGWESSPAPDGAGVLLRRAARTTRAQAFVLYGAALAAAAAFVATAGAALRGGQPATSLLASLPALLVAAGLALAAVYVHAGGRVLAVAPGRLEVRRFVLDRWRVRAVPVGFLSLERSRDSDGDLVHRLLAHGPGPLTLGSSMNDPGELLHLGRWLAARLGVRFDAPKDLADA